MLPLRNKCATIRESSKEDDPMERQERIAAEVRMQLGQLGLRQTSQGFLYLARAVEIVVEDPVVMSDGLVKKWMYPAIGREFYLTGDGVEADIRWTLGSIWKRGNRDALCRLAGRELARRPTNCEFFWMMAEKVKERLEAEKLNQSSVDK